MGSGDGIQDQQPAPGSKRRMWWVGGASANPPSPRKIDQLGDRNENVIPLGPTTGRPRPLLFLPVIPAASATRIHTISQVARTDPTRIRRQFPCVRVPTTTRTRVATR